MVGKSGSDRISRKPAPGPGRPHGALRISAAYSNPCLLSATRFLNPIRYLPDIDSTPHLPGFKFGRDFSPRQAGAKSARQIQPQEPSTTSERRVSHGARCVFVSDRSPLIPNCTRWSLPPRGPDLRQLGPLPARNPCLVRVAYSTRFPIASGPHDSKQIDVTQTRKTRYSQQAQNDRWVSGKWPDGPDGRAVERAAPVR